MQFDDRLATVLRARAGGERTARTQFRQLVDLMARPPAGANAELAAEAWLRLDALAETIPAQERAEILREPGVRLANARIVFHFADQEPPVAAAALAVAELDGPGWQALIPRLPVRARGFLRLRRDLPEAATALLDRLGVHDRGLPEPERRSEAGPLPPPPQAQPIAANDADPPAAPLPERAASEIGAIRQRIESFRQSRADRAGATEPAQRDHPRLPLGEAGGSEGARVLEGFGFTTDPTATIDWAEDTAAPMMRHASLAALLDEPARDRLRRHQPLAGIALALPGAPALAGEWVLDAQPRFSPDNGAFEGYAGRFRRPFYADAVPDRADDHSDRLRQLLHELRTPVNAIQGFAEILQQQMFGPVPHEYRAHAAGIAGDSARILAGFDELDRLAKLESGDREIEPGEADLAIIVAGQARQLDAILARREAGFDVEVAPDVAVAIARGEAEALAWRLLATLAGTLAPGQRAQVSLKTKKGRARLKCVLPGKKGAAEALFTTNTKGGGGPVSAGIFGTGFALRLARAEAEAAGGTLQASGRKLVLDLPLLTASRAEPSAAGEPQEAAHS